MNIKRYLAPLLVLLPMLAFGQTAAEMDGMLEAETVSAAKAARFVLGTVDLLPAGLSGPEAERAAYDMAASKGWIKALSGEALTLKDTAFLVMNAFELKGGLMYSLVKSPRYAYREMVYRKLIQGQTDQAMKVSGPRFLTILDKTSLYAGDGGSK